MVDSCTIVLVVASPLEINHCRWGDIRDPIRYPHLFKNRLQTEHSTEITFTIKLKPIRKECRLPFKNACQYDFF